VGRRNTIYKNESNKSHTRKKKQKKKQENNQGNKIIRSFFIVTAKGAIYIRNNTHWTLHHLLPPAYKLRLDNVSEEIQYTTMASAISFTLFSPIELLSKCI
jgi:hypothetical protein